MLGIDAYIRTSLRPRSLQLLVALDELRQLGKVAAFMNVTQPAVSKALAEMERGLGLRLFERTARGVHPTTYGECVIRHARSILGSLAQARDELLGLASGSSGSLRVGVLATAAPVLLPRGLAELKKRQPNMTVLVREGTIEALLPELWLGNLDLVVGRLPDRHIAPALGEKVLMQEGIALVTGCHHPLASRKRVAWEHLTGYPWVLPPVNTLLRAPLERAFERRGITLPANRIETLSLHVIRTYLHHTDAIAALAADVSRYFESERQLAVLPIELPGLVRPVGVMWSRQRPLSPAAQALIETLEATVQRLTPARGERRVSARRRYSGLAVPYHPYGSVA